MSALIQTRVVALLATLALATTGMMAIPSAVLADEEQPSPYAKADDSWIMLKGTVKSAGVDSFVLDYEDGEVIVEMDDGDLLGDAYKIMPGDEVLVSGRIDDDFFESTSIEAAAVHVKNINATFVASPTDEEGSVALNPFSFAQPLVEDEYHLIGTVSKIEDDGFVVDIGARSISVDVDQLDGNPLDDEGYLKIETGDRVAVSGLIDDNWFLDRELEALSLVKLNRPAS